MKKPPAILHALANGPPGLSGYAVRSRNQLKAQQQAGLPVYAALSPRFNKGQFGRWRRPSREVAAYDGIPWRHFDPAALPLTDRLMYLLSEVPRMSRLPLYWNLCAAIDHGYAGYLAQALDFRADLVVVHSPAIHTGYGFELARLLKVPVIYDAHGRTEETQVAFQGEAYRETRDYQREAETELAVMRSAVHCFVICETLREDYAGRGIPLEKMTVIENGIDPKDFSGSPERDAELQREWGLEGSQVMGYVSTLNSYEGIDLMIEAVQLLHAENVPVKALIVGDGKQRESLQALARRLGVERHVCFTGRVPHAEVAKYFALMDVFVVPRKRLRVCELVTPLKPFEAMAMGRPVIVSDLPALREVIQGGRYGRTFPPNDARALARQCRELFARPEELRALGQKSREWVLRERTWQVLAEKQKQVFERFASAQQ